MATQREILFGAGLVGTVALYLLSRTDAGAAVAADVVGAAVSALKSRGLRNNNPGNIRFIADPAKAWRGQIANDNGYGVYSHMSEGVRALGKQLEAYSKRGLRSVQAIISTWAPSNENNTSAYVAAVARELKVDAGQVLDVRAYLPRLAAAIIKHENGSNPLSLDEVTRWVYQP